MLRLPILLLALILCAPGFTGPPYPWGPLPTAEPLQDRLPAPTGWVRQPLPADSFGAWLRDLPLKPGRPPVLLHDGRPKARQDVHVAVLDLDAGTRDLQQCADAVIRLRAEYLWAAGRLDALHFDFTSGDRSSFTRWAQGWRPVVTGSRVTWTRTAAPDDSYESFQRWLRSVFTYAGTVSLARELIPVAPADAVAPGDVLVQGGSPGHAVIVLDVAVHPETGARSFLLAQSYMPAQDVHVLRNPEDPAREPWYDEAAFAGGLHTPEWTFRREDLRRWPAP